MLFCLTGAHFSPSRGDILTHVRKQIAAIDRAAQTELGNGYGTREGVRGWLLGKDDVLMGDGEGLTDGAIIKAFSASNI